MSAPNPTWYDLLGVPRDADPATIKAAWRDATDKFEPGAGGGQFRLFSEAADVLLDPVRRAEYDAMLDAASASKPGSTSTPPPAEPEPDAEPDAEPAADPGAGPSPETAPDRAPDSEGVGKGTGKDRGRSPAPRWLLAALAAVTAIAVVVAVVGVVLMADRAHDEQVSFWQGLVHGDGPTKEAAADSATATAQRALAAVLSYDYRHMEADRDKALKFLTKGYGKEFKKTFDELLTTGASPGKPGNAVKTKTVVKATVMNVGVVHAETDKVRVLAFVDQSAQKGDRTPSVFQNRVTATLVKQGNDWLIDDLQSY